MTLGVASPRYQKSGTAINGRIDGPNTTCGRKSRPPQADETQPTATADPAYSRALLVSFAVSVPPDDRLKLKAESQGDGSRGSEGALAN